MIYLSTHTMGGGAARAVLHYLPITHYRTDELQVGDLLWTEPDCAALVASITLQPNGEYKVLDVNRNGGYYCAAHTHTAVPREILSGTGEQRVAHARGDFWLPTFLSTPRE